MSSICLTPIGVQARESALKASAPASLLSYFFPSLTSHFFETSKLLLTSLFFHPKTPSLMANICAKCLGCLLRQTACLFGKKLFMTFLSYFTQTGKIQFQRSQLFALFSLQLKCYKCSTGIRRLTQQPLLTISLPKALKCIEISQHIAESNIPLAYCFN